MKKFFALLLALVMALGLLAGCGSKDTNSDAQNNESDTKKIETLKVAFVPSREPQEIITATEPLKQMLKDELANQGYEVSDVEITVGTTYEAVGEGLEAGTIDVGLIPGGTYVLYDDGAEVILTATRNGLSKDSDNAKDWNDGPPTEAAQKHHIYIARNNRRIPHNKTCKQNDSHGNQQYALKLMPEIFFLFTALLLIPGCILFLCAARHSIRTP